MSKTVAAEKGIEAGHRMSSSRSTSSGCWSHRREDVRAIEDAKRPEARARRIAAAVEKMLAEA